MNTQITDDILHLLNCAKAMQNKIKSKYKSEYHLQETRRGSDISNCWIFCYNFLSDFDSVIENTGITEWTETKLVYSVIEKGRLKEFSYDICNEFE